MFLRDAEELLKKIITVILRKCKLVLLSSSLVGSAKALNSKQTVSAEAQPIVNVPKLLHVLDKLIYIRVELCLPTFSLHVVVYFVCEQIALKRCKNFPLNNYEISLL